MKGKPNGTQKNPKVRLRNKSGQKRGRVIQVRVSDNEFRKIRAAFGRRAAAMARLMLLGHEVPERTALESTKTQVLIHALFAHFVATQPLRDWIRLNGDGPTKALLGKEIDAFNNLARICYSNS